MSPTLLRGSWLFPGELAPRAGAKPKGFTARSKTVVVGVEFAAVVVVVVVVIVVVVVVVVVFAVAARCVCHVFQKHEKMTALILTQ